MLLEKENIPYGHQTIDEADIQAVISVLRSDYLTTGPSVETFEQKVAAIRAPGMPLQLQTARRRSILPAWPQESGKATKSSRLR